jgi:riboflavin kinase / FMN adenylyltransferase
MAAFTHIPIGLTGPPAEVRGAALALGNLDGVHLGHQAVIASARLAAAAANAPLAAGVFEPHPRRVFQTDAPPFQLQSTAQRARALAGLGVEILYDIAFDRTLAGLTDEAFCTNVLGAQIGARHVAVGADFCFGRGRMGSAESLARHGARVGFSVSAIGPIDDRDSPGKVSSTAIRDALAEGAVNTAARLLGRPWAIEGVVGPGAQRGRTIGFPTANVALGAYLRPRFGVYAVRVDVGRGVLRPGVANLGVKPTVGGVEAPLLEVHVFNFEGDLYGRRIEAALIAFLRPERRFDTFPALVAQINEDAAAARRVLG